MTAPVKYVVKKDMFLTVLTTQDSGMVDAPVGTELVVEKGDLYINGQLTSDDHVQLEYHKFIEKVTENK
jgi:hypothetical protein